MTTRTAVPDGAPIWIDLATSDVAASRAFYGALFGWTSEEPDPELGGYLNFNRDGERVAGCMGNMPGACGDVWTAYLATSDIEKSCEQVLTAGGAVHAAAMEVRDLGKMAIVADPTGAAIGLWQPGTHKGLLTVAEPGHASWFELHTNDFAGTLAFTHEVFGWRNELMADTDEFRYAVAHLDDEEVAGVQGISDGRDPQWTVAFGVEDTDAALKRAVELGATMTGEPVDSPYGRLAWATDPTGARFTLVASTLVS